MNKFLKISLITLASILGLFYIMFLITPPIFNALYDLDKHKADIQKIVKESAKLNLDYSKIKIYTTPLLSAGAIIEGINIKLNDNSTIFSADKIKGGIALPSLLTLTIKTANCNVENPYINLEIVDDEQYKILKVVEDIINENNAKPKPQVTQQDEIINKIVEKIRIKIPSIKLTNYSAIINDLKSNHNLKLKGEKLIVGYNGARNSFKLKTDAKLLSDDKENIIANIDIISSLPTPEKTTEATDPEEKIAIPFVNIVSIYQNYDLKLKVNSKLKIKNTKTHGFVGFGFLNIDDLNLKLSDIRLPNSYLHAIFQGKTIKYDSNIYAKADEKISLLGEFKYGKKPRIKTTILSDKLHFSNLVALLEGLLDSLNIKNDLAQINTTGYIIADTTIKTNFKKLKSTGSIIIKDGSFINPKTNIGIKDVIANLIFDNNVLNIKDTSLTINNAKLNANGLIDNKSNANIKLNIDKLSLKELYNAFAPKELKQAYKLNNGLLSANINVKGKLDKLNAKLNTSLEDLNLSDTAKTLVVSNKKLNFDFNAEPKMLNGKIKNNGLNINLPAIKTTANINNLVLNIDNANITINPFDLIYNNDSKINIEGQIANYPKEANINILANGKIATKDLNQTLGKEIAHFIPSKGIIPLKATFKGDLKNQELLAQIYANKDNFITPINLSNLLNRETIAQIDVKLHGNKIKIKDSGLFIAQNGFNNELEQNMLNAQKIIDLTAILDNGHINLFRINIPEEQVGNIGIFNKSNFKAKGKITLNGRPDNLNFGGDLKIYDIDIPEILFKTKLIDLDFFSDGLNVKTNTININGSTINASLKAYLKPIGNIFKIDNIETKSSLINVDKALVVVEKLMKYMPPQSTTNTVKSATPADIPLIADGKFDIKKLTTGAIVVENIKGNLGIKNNDLVISNLDCNTFSGKVKGDVKMNLLSSLLTIKLTGKNLDSNKAMTDAVNMKNMISGNLAFKTDISLKGSTLEEQMKSLKGDVDFELQDGQYGPFAKLENFFLAENIRENPFFKNTIGVILTPITTIDSTHYEKLNGKVSFDKGVVSLGSIKSQGDILCILINGNMNLLTNELNSKVRVRLASAVSDMLGPIAMANPINLVKNTPGLNVASSKLFSVFSEVVDESEYKEIPDFTKNHSDDYATKFQIILDGNVTKPLSLVKSFKWLALQTDMDKAKEFSANYQKEELMKQLQTQYEENHKLKVGVEKILKMDTTAPEVKKILEQEALAAKEQAQNQVQTKKQELEKQVQNKIEAKKQEQEQKVLDIQNKLEAKKQEQEQKIIEAQDLLKSKLKERLNSAIPQAQDSSAELE